MSERKFVVLLTGGAGYVGSHVNHYLLGKGYQTLILDNLSRGKREQLTGGTFFEGDVADKEILDRLFSQFSIGAVFHFAAKIDVGESVCNPLLYYQNNVGATLTLLEAMQRHGISKFVFSSSAAVYGMPRAKVVSERHPCQPINPYGRTKRCIEQVLEDLAVSKRMTFVALRYFNAAGGDPSRHVLQLQTHASNLIPILLQNLSREKPEITLFGTDYPTPDGTCIRDYVHVMDLAQAHHLALQYLCAGGASDAFNLGNGKGYSVREVVDGMESVCGISFRRKVGERRPGDPPVLVASSAKAKKILGWKPTYCQLHTILSHACQAQRWVEER